MYNNSNYVSSDTRFISQPADYINYLSKENEWKQIMLTRQADTIGMIKELIDNGATEVYFKRYKVVKEFKK